MSDADVLPSEAVDEFKILFYGYVPDNFPTGWGTTAAVAPTVAFVRHGDRKIVYDPGTVPNARAILDPLEELGYQAGDITDVIVSHHHPDHCVNIALFPNASLQDFWGTYKGDQWFLRNTQTGYDVTPGIRLMHTPGHTESDMSTLVATQEGLVTFTHLWWTDKIPADDDPVALDQPAFHENRERILALDPYLIVPGHGPAFAPSAGIPR